MCPASYGFQDRSDLMDYQITANNKHPMYKSAKSMFQIPETGGDQVWLNFKGVFHMEMLYKLMQEILERNGYMDQDDGKDKMEHYYYENRAPDGTKNEVWYWWRTKKSSKSENNPAIGNEHVEFLLNIDVQILGLKDEVIVVEGQKFKMNSGEISIYIKPYLNQLHEQEKWKDSVIIGPFYEWWRQRVFRPQKQQMVAQQYDEFNLVYGSIKQYLKLMHYTPLPSEFHPQLGVPQYKI